MWSWIMKFLALLIPSVIKEFIKKSPPTMEYGESGGEFEESVKDQIDDQIPDGPGGRK